jgi:hypothetical protein
MNKLDAFNNDKVKCKKCKNYYEIDPSNPCLLCKGCIKKWSEKVRDLDRRGLLHKNLHKAFEDWCKNELEDWCKNEQT